MKHQVLRRIQWEIKDDGPLSSNALTDLKLSIKNVFNEEMISVKQFVFKNKHLDVVLAFAMS